MAKQETTCDDILKELRAKQYRPVYYLMGEESYYIDLISDYIVDNVLTDTEKVFNLTVVYGADVDIATVINAAKRYPMMSERQVVVVKEAQAIRNMEELSYYLQKPLTRHKNVQPTSVVHSPASLVPLRGVAPPSENGKIVLPHPLPVYRPDGQFRHAGQRNRLA